MSLSPPRERNNGDRTYQFYWCYQCNRSVRIASDNPSQIICPRCLGQFLQEIDTTRPRAFNEIITWDPFPEARLLEALSLVLDPPLRGLNNGVGRGDEAETEAARNRGRRWLRRRSHSREHWEAEADTGVPGRRRNNELGGRLGWPFGNGLGAQGRTWIVLRPTGPPGQNGPFPQSENMRPPRFELRDFFSGPGLNELIEELTQNDRPGPPPAPDSAINAMPTLHNSCPVCRHEVPVPSDESDESHEGEDRRVRCMRLRQLASLWPFRSRYRRINPQDRDVTPHRGLNQKISNSSMLPYQDQQSAGLNDISCFLPINVAAPGTSSLSTLMIQTFVNYDHDPRSIRDLYHRPCHTWEIKLKRIAKTLVKQVTEDTMLRQIRADAYPKSGP
ncbi:hypothetical protein CK203_012560 [Vitis vinifera]|uniref:RING-type E3 ubiquitin transferase n=1 Tax=Vitis vinifera TaxID=29760 RepID=A0A438KMP9_VITVI|nr:hypothetical protein CK203_012560 [Vitis vinifera]